MLSCVRAFEFLRGDNGQVDESGRKEFNEIIANCIQQISAIIELYEAGEHLKVTKGASPMSVQIIPNVAKIKVEKKFVLRALALAPPQPQGQSAPATEMPQLSESEKKQLQDIE